MTDPRASIIGRRTEEIGRIAAFASGKGGVGKSACAAVAALQLAREGQRVGLFDMDFTGASAHLFLGTELRFPEEERGILPIDAGYGLRFMSAAAYAGERGFALRGGEVTDVFLELFAITRWGALDCLILDMPPGMGDAVLDLIRYLPSLSAVLVSTPSKVSRQVVARMAGLFREAGVPVAGRIENMCSGGEKAVREKSAGGRPGAHHGAAETGTAVQRNAPADEELPLLATVPVSSTLEGAIGDPAALLATDFAGALRPAALSLCSPAGGER